MSYIIKKGSLHEEHKRKIFTSFRQHAFECTGNEGIKDEPILFELYNENVYVGSLVVLIFWGQLHIKYMIIEPSYRQQGYGSALINHALSFGKDLGCDFAFVETMSFQAPEFYQKLGFKVDFVRHGYSQNTSFYYLSKCL